MSRCVFPVPLSPINSTGSARLYCGNVYNLPEALGQFDVVVVAQILVHLRDPRLKGRREWGKAIICSGTQDDCHCLRDPKNKDRELGADYYDRLHAIGESGPHGCRVSEGSKVRGWLSGGFMQGAGSIRERRNRRFGGSNTWLLN